MQDLDEPAVADHLNALASEDGPDAVAEPGLAEDVRRHPELRKRIDERLRQPAIIAFGALLERAVARGEIDAVPRASAETLLDVIAGTMLMRILRNDESAQGWEDELIDLILRGIGAR